MVIYMTNSIGAIIGSVREERGISQKELAFRLEKYGVSVTNQAVSKWENGTTLPNARQFVAICDVLEIEDVTGVFLGKKSGGIFEGLNSTGIKKAMEYVELLKASGMYKRDGEIISLRKLPLYDIAVSAGTGQFLDSDRYELVEVGEEVPLTANFGVRISGDSMEPKFQHGQVVWVTQERNIKTGDIGIFLYDGDVYCKKLEKTPHGIRLVSENPRYEPIIIKPEREFRVFGRVVA